jgi:hypothetical protein
MGLLVSVLGIYMPEYIKKSALTQLFNFTAAAFEAKVPPLAGLDSQEVLAAYGLFTRDHAEQRLRDASAGEAVKQCLYRSAVEMGRRYEKWLRPRTVQDVMAIGRVFYRILAIDFQGDARGEVVIDRCYFSRFYSCEVCRFMSAMDAGLFAGLSKGGELMFTSRITEGHPCCRAHFRLPEDSK